MPRKIITVVLTAAGFAALAASPDARAERDLPFATELDSCIAAIYRRIDVEGAERVRHIVRDSKSAIDGYELRISTTVYGAGSSRSYDAVCATRGALNPYRLVIDGDRV